jgi:hypothetical protein
MKSIKRKERELKSFMQGVLICGFVVVMILVIMYGDMNA